MKKPLPTSERKYQSIVWVSFKALNHIMSRKSCSIEEYLRTRPNVRCLKTGANPEYIITFNYEITLENMTVMMKRLFGKSWHIVDKYTKIQIKVEDITPLTYGGTETTRSIRNIIYTPMRG